MLHAFGLFAGLFGLGFAGLAALYAVVSLAYPVFVVWMVIDGILRSDVEYPGSYANRKVLWVVLMVLVHPIAIAYFFMVFAKIKRGRAAPAAYTAASPS
jgi:hypothetical protein